MIPQAIDAARPRQAVIRHQPMPPAPLTLRRAEYAAHRRATWPQRWALGWIRIARRAARGAVAAIHTFSMQLADISLTAMLAIVLLVVIEFFKAVS